LVPAIKAGDGAAVASMLDKGAGLNERGEDGATPLMAAALYSNAAMVRLLLDRGAEPNARSGSGATALLWGLGDMEKVKLLLARGADPKAAANSGRTPLHVAAMIDGGFEAVKLLVEKGAAPDAKDENGATPLMEAAAAFDTRSTAFLLARGANPNAADRGGRTPLISAVSASSLPSIKLLLAHGADPNAGGLFGITPLLLAILKDDTEAFRALVARGANVNGRDGAENTALMWAAFSEHNNTEILADLLKAGVDVHAKNKLGETAIEWASRRGDTPVVRMLKTAGAVMENKASATPAVSREHAAEAGEAVRRAVAILQKGSAGFSKKAACSSCHNQSLPAMAAVAARERGIAIDSEQLRELAVFSRKSFSPGADKMLEGVEFIPDLPITGSYTMVGLAADAYAADRMTTATVQHLAFRQHSDGRWTTFAPRPPMEFSDVTATTLSMRALQIYAPEGRAPEFRRRVEKAREWLLSAKPRSTEDHAMRLKGLVWSKAKPGEIERAARALAAEQRPDGGWSQLSSLESDAYATGQALTALKMAGMSPKTELYRRGVDFLLRTQFEDGSWFVATRSFPFQPYMEYGFPHGKNQWVSSAATAWAAMAIAESLDAPAETRVAVSR
jgi:ankyrin repeat protein